MCEIHMIYYLVIALFTCLMDWLMCQDPTGNGGFFFFKIILKEIDSQQAFHNTVSQDFLNGVYS